MIKYVLGSLLFVSCLYAGNTDTEIKRVTQAIGSETRLATLYFKRAGLYADQGDYDKALKDFDKVGIFNPGHKGLDYEMAKTYVNAGRPQKALDLISQVLSTLKNPTQRRAYLILKADAYNLQENYKAGIKIYEVLNKQGEGLSSFELTKLSSAYYDLGKSRKSISILKNALREDNSNYILAEKMVELSIEEGSYSLAHIMIERMLKDKSKRANTYQLQAVLFESEDKLDEALKSNALAHESFLKISKKAQRLESNKRLKNKILAFELRLHEDDRARLN